MVRIKLPTVPFSMTDRYRNVWACTKHRGIRSTLLDQRGGSLQNTRRRVEPIGKISDLLCHGVLIAESDCLIHGWQHHRGVTIVLVRSVNQVSEPRARDETVWS